MEIIGMENEHWIIATIGLFFIEAIFNTGRLTGLAIASAIMSAITTQLTNVAIFDQISLLILLSSATQVAFISYKKHAPRRRLVGTKIKINNTFTDNRKHILNGMSFFVKSNRKLEPGDVAIISKVKGDTTQLRKI